MNTNNSPNTSIGQHFLINPRILNLIAAQVPENSDIIELGAGQGQLTEKLVKAAKNITAIEIDDRFFESLDGLTRPFPKLKVHIGDILKFDFKYYSLPWIVGNIPYHITEPLLHKLIKQPISGCILLVGDKFAYEATTVDPESKYFGKLSFLVNTFFVPEIISWVDRTEFNPPPRTKSALIRLTHRPEYDYESRGLFLAKQLFLTASHSPLVKNALTEALIKFQSSPLTKNEARKIISEMELPDSILYTSFEHLNNQNYQTLCRLLK
ncbi:MAG: rRNA adenine dimethyltransferase family protein [Candidatus Shapirobacteria bacterium]